MPDVTTYESPYGTVTIGPDYCAISADGNQLWNWSHKPGANWPCSTLEDFDSVEVAFDTSGLVDLETAPDDHGEWDDEIGGYDESTAIDLDCNELNAWTSDVLGECLPADHPCHFVTVGQFHEEN